MAVQTKLPLLLVTLWLLVASIQRGQAHPSRPASCAASLQTQLSALLHTKQRCKQPVFKDCCQVCLYFAKIIIILIVAVDKKLLKIKKQH